MTGKLKYTILTIITIVFFLANIFFGSVDISFSEVLDVILQKSNTTDPSHIIITASRIPQAITALLSGAGLAISGLMLQTLFNNPLAAPSILGISSGSGLGVAIVILLLGGSVASLGLFGHLAVVIGAMIGAMIVLAILTLFSIKIKSNTMLLVIGIMVGYIATSLVTLLSYMSESEGVVSFVFWGMGDFSSVNNSNLTYFTLFISIGLICSMLLIKPLNALLLGEKYAQNLGVNINKTRIIILLTTGLLTATITAFCGPISFIGLAVPHIARLTFATSNHKVLIPTTIIIGANVAMLCNLLTVVFTSGTVIPLNAITPLMGAPVIIYIIVNKKKIAYFN